ncbi:conserved hypothetical protein [Histoplasma capsulatum G186AR]|uniref:Transcription factor Rba50 n=2 Tax=Ajellomyces capsulatus TaxID=5037 RepID=C0NXW7_AJECG|nr:uncharacterized protein HCBG_07761 [Histoplasma capsulatum G186AR]EEH03635.1 conserved hypothetical protein [Histoplasma capsulatum G186AR]KAG5293794.1 transcription factor Rba50 [Histoplasma capsulatum]QSS75246.1 transcription factor Rba50 [Histoplasma capsulatum G186AR]
MAIRGERFHIDLSDDDGSSDDHGFACSINSPSLGLIGDIKERASSSTPVPPAPPRAPSNSAGFPESRKRYTVSSFKKQRADPDAPRNHPLPPKHYSGRVNPGQTLSYAQNEKRSIEEENKRRLAAMSPAEIERERGELISSLPQSLIERLLRRANIEEDHQHEEMKHRVNKEIKEDNSPKVLTGEQEKASTQSQKSSKSVSFDIPSSETGEQSLAAADSEALEQLAQPSSIIDNLPPHQPPSELFPASDFPTGPIHFPKPPPRQSPMPNLNPSSSSFLADLQTHYFPDIPHDPSSLSWLQPSPPPSPSSSHAPSNPSISPYHPASTATSISPAALRFSLTGALLAPRTSLSIPTTHGLHHHAADPEAAGYTIPELATLARSTLPAQRCLAWQVLGRFLYRLGVGEFGERGSALVEGLWAVVEREGVVAGMLAEAGGGSSGSKNEFTAATAASNAARIGKHASARAWATEAVWLWRKGGGGDRGLTKEGVLRSKEQIMGGSGDRGPS